MKRTDIEEGKDYAIGTQADLRRLWRPLPKATVVSTTQVYRYWDPEKKENVTTTNKEAADRHKSFTRTPERGIFVRFDDQDEQVFIKTSKVLMLWEEFVPIWNTKADDSNRRKAAGTEIDKLLGERGIEAIQKKLYRWDEETQSFPDAEVTVKVSDLRKVLN